MFNVTSWSLYFREKLCQNQLHFQILSFEKETIGLPLGSWAFMEGKKMGFRGKMN